VQAPESLYRKSLIYLACPYSDPNKDIRESRYKEALKATVELFRIGNHVYSPIVHSHYIEVGLGIEKPGFDFWRDYDLRLISHSDILMVLTICGWNKSKGVAAEIDYAQSIRLPVIYISPK